MDRLRSLSSGLLVAGSLLLLGGDLLQAGGDKFLWTVLLWLAFMGFGAGLVLLPVAFQLGKHSLAIAGAACAFVGCFAGAGMQVLFRTWAVLEAANQTAAVDLLRDHVPLRLSTLVPGILFPVGLLILAVGIRRARVMPRTVPLTLALGAILFPVGHAVGLLPALIGGDLVLVAAFFLLYVNRERALRAAPVEATA